MSTLSSWIDPDELSQLLPFLLPETEQEQEPEPGDEPESADERDDRVLESQESGLATGDASGEDDLDFDRPDAYDAAAYPEPEDDADESGVPVRQAAAVQAAVALERARERANEGGLLRAAASVSTDESTAEAQPEEPEASAPSEAFEPDEPEAEAMSAEDDDDAPPPGTFRYRLADFARSAVALTQGSDPVITDSQSFPLFPAPNGNATERARTIDSILKMNRNLGQFPGQSENPSDRITQISLGEAEWLCILTQNSASGGVCASLRIPGPIAQETAEQLHADLRAALIGPAG